MWKYCENDNRYVSLHDCHATQVLYEKGVLTFVFDEGIWISEEYPHNMFDKIVRTDRAEVKCYLETEDESDVTIYIFKQKMSKTVREEWKLSKLVECVNNEKYTLEFLYQYKGYNSMIIECCLWSYKKPYDRECQLKLSITEVQYCWNNLCEGRE